MKSRAWYTGSAIVILSGLLAVAVTRGSRFVQAPAHLFVAEGREDQSGDRLDSDATISVLFYGVHGNRLYRANLTALGDGSLSSGDILFDAARIASVRIRTGNSAGPNDTRRDILVMDDFIFGKPEAITSHDCQTATLPEMN